MNARVQEISGLNISFVTNLAAEIKTNTGLETQKSVSPSCHSLGIQADEGAAQSSGRLSCHPYIVASISSSCHTSAGKKGTKGSGKHTLSF